MYSKIQEIKKTNSSILCIGLDTELNKLPVALQNGDVFSILEFNKNIIEATKDLVCAYKINFAFYEQFGYVGFDILKKTFEMIPENIFTIADSKRGDIGNTSQAYAKSCFEYFKADSITVNPYMGHDSIEPFLEYKDKFVFLLTLTSNSGSGNFQRLDTGGMPLYKQVVIQSSKWANKNNLGYVIGATHPDEIDDLRQIAPDRIFLIPGIGSQGGNLEATIKANADGPAIVNISRAIIYASKEKNYAEKAREKAINFKLSLI